jgi:hypothetical protein
MDFDNLFVDGLGEFSQLHPDEYGVILDEDDLADLNEILLQLQEDTEESKYHYITSIQFIYSLYIIIVSFYQIRQPSES